EYYTSLKRIPKVELMGHRSDPFKLIDSAACVATLTGTMGFEAVLRGKPCLVFGDAAYVGCEGVFRINSFQDLEDAFKALFKDHFVVDRNKVITYVQRALSNTVC